MRREEQAAQKQADELIALCTEQGIPFFIAWGTILRGWALAAHGRGEEEGIVQIRQGLAAFRATVAGNWQTYFLALLAEAYGKTGQTEEGLNALAEALGIVSKTGEQLYDAELYRLKGELTFQLETRGWRLETGSSSPQASSLKPLAPSGVVQEAEGYFLKAIDIARKQHAKSLELRAVVSLVRL